MKCFVSFVILLNCLSVTTWSVAGDPGTKLAQVAGNHLQYADQAPDTPRITAEMVETPSLVFEIRAVVDSTRNAERVLRKEYVVGQHPELARRLGELKKTSRMRILHIQLKYARKEGRTELEKRILTSIENLQRPAAPGGPRLSGRTFPPPEAQAAVTPSGGSCP